MPRGRAAASPAPTEARKRAASKSTAREAKTQTLASSPEAAAPSARATTPVRKRATKAKATAQPVDSEPTVAAAAPAPTTSVSEPVAAPDVVAAAAPSAPTAAGANELTIFLALLCAIGVVAHQLSAVRFLSDNVLALVAVGPTLAMGILLLRTAVAKGSLVRESFTTWVLLFVILVSTCDAVKALSTGEVNVLTPALTVIITIFDAVCGISLVMAMLNAEHILPSQIVSIAAALSVLVGITYVEKQRSWDAVAQAFLPIENATELTEWAQKLTVVLGTGAAAIAASRAFTALLGRRNDVGQHLAAAVALLLLSPTFACVVSYRSLRMHAFASPYVCSAFGIPRVNAALTDDLHKSLVVPVTQWTAVLLLTYASA